MRYKQAAKLAVDVCQELNGFCEVINIAGSLRRISGMQGREMMEVKDIDLICVPRYTEAVTLDLFGGNVIAEKKVSVNFSGTLKRLGTITKGTPDGRYMSLIIQGNKVDIFMPQAADYYRQYCIRTGSAQFVEWNISKRWVKNGWCGTDQGLRRIEDCREIVSATEKKRWEVIKEGDKPPAWQSEEHFFEWLGVKWIAPRLRSI
jgi:DNA polymerase/3'-5' exonuclease PolX